MKNSRAVVEARHSKIIEILKSGASNKVDDLAAKLSVSAITIRRDLQHLETKGIVKRLYGGANLVDPVMGQLSAGDFTIEQQAIAAYATRMIEDGDTIFINSGCTSVRLLRYIQNKNITVVTSNLLALRMELSPGIQIMLTGGEVCSRDSSLVGDFVLNSLKMVTASKAFLGVNGISAAGGMTTTVPQKMMVNKTMLDRCNGPKIVVTDSSKIGRRLNFFSAPITDVSCIITDNKADRDEVRRIEECGVQVILIDPMTEKLL